MENTTTTQVITPGYNCRLKIAFTATRKGPVAYYQGGGLSRRWIRIGLEAARSFVAQDQADRIEFFSIREWTETKWKEVR